MKNYLFFYLALALVISCGKENVNSSAEKHDIHIESLPFSQLNLKDLSDFKPVTKNWSIVSDAYVDRSKKKTISGTQGTGVLLNIPKGEMKKNIFTKLEHGDILLEAEVMMPVGSNSGIYLQGRYEIQLLDSWKVKKPKYSDIGGIYQRWDKSRKKGKQGYQGHSPKLNAAKAPGLWQKLKINFSAPKFNKAGKKVADAKFNEVWLNGVLIHENVKVTGPTRAAAYNDEKALGPIMIQGDHGPVALRNLKYKLFQNGKIKFNNVKLQEFNKIYLDSIPDLRMVKSSGKKDIKSFSLKTIKSRSYKKTALFTGNLIVPTTGEYLLNFEANIGGVGTFYFNNKKITSNLVTLTAGENIPFSLAICKSKPAIEEFHLTIEGPGFQKQNLDPTDKLKRKKPRRARGMSISAKKEVQTQRSCMRHKGNIKTHCISVGTPENIHYTFDANKGSLLLAWDGDTFFDASEMWLARGQEQFGTPSDFKLSLYGELEFAPLKNVDDTWPVQEEENDTNKFVGYEFKSNGYPEFTNNIYGSIVKNEFTPSTTDRKLTRTVNVNGSNEIFHKIAEGSQIKQLPDGSYIINDDSYFISFSEKNALKPFVRKNNGKEELLVKIPSGSQSLIYSIIW
jgi:hypothetical protein